MKILSNKLRIKLLLYLLHHVYQINKPDKRKCKVYEGIFPVYTNSSGRLDLKLYCPNRKVLGRSRSIYRKEPETIEWINTFSAEDILFDVGANIGLYSLLAAKRGTKVVAFEPEPQNFAVLTANVYLNELADRIIPLNLAVANRIMIDYLYMPVYGFGTAFNRFGKAPDSEGDTAAYSAKQAVMSYSLDAFTAAFPEYSPTHIKIDVDGLENLIVSGAIRTIENPRVRTLLVEFEDTIGADRQSLDLITSKGFTVRSKHPRRQANTFNYIFSRE